MSKIRCFPLAEKDITELYIVKSFIISSLAGNLPAISKESTIRSFCVTMIALLRLR